MTLEACAQVYRTPVGSWASVEGDVEVEQWKPIVKILNTELSAHHLDPARMGQIVDGSIEISGVRKPQMRVPQN